MASGTVIPRSAAVLHCQARLKTTATSTTAQAGWTARTTHEAMVLARAVLDSNGVTTRMWTNVAPKASSSIGTSGVKISGTLRKT